ncbi:MAG: dependent protein [Blastocatellia bacterium]|nr:dependent protein [Blastocatellia bacterium]
MRLQIASAVERSKRAPEDVTLVVVTKTHPPGIVKNAIAAGVTDLGENRIQEADEKIAAVGRNAARWHLIGHLQSNKARRAVTLFDLVHSLDSAELARRLDRMCEEEGRAELPVLVQLNLAGEKTKSGIAVRDLSKVVEAVTACKHLRLSGLMTVPPFFADSEMARPLFRRLRELRDELKAQGVFAAGPGELSMGMTHDFPVAIEEGATLVRIGTAIFGERG